MASCKNVFTEHICEMFADNVFLPKKAIFAISIHSMLEDDHGLFEFP